METKAYKHESSHIGHVLFVLLAFVIGGVIGYAVGQDWEVAKNTEDAAYAPATTTTTSSTTASPSAATTSTSTAATLGWKTYTNGQGFGYNIKYPQRLSGDSEDWVSAEYSVNSYGNNSVGFGTPSSKSGGYTWGVSVYASTQKTKSAAINEQGSQFSDRVVTSSAVTINGKSATLVTVTTASVPTWISKVVYIENNNKLYVISNGAVDNSSFTDFYNTFTLSN